MGEQKFLLQFEEPRPPPVTKPLIQWGVLCTFMGAETCPKLI